MPVGRWQQQGAALPQCGVESSWLILGCKATFKAFGHAIHGSCPGLNATCTPGAAAASGQNTVEREGISIVPPAKFIMIGSGNPAEGELRPQLLDRFGTSVNVVTLQDTAQRTQLVMDRLAYETVRLNGV